ncbi:MAG: hypothetical protein DBX55_00490 [Verrucomicrobia bacterium]|nr:MAG: hypothetical protein DBX55_00490 [Verrucomicrobiota bacterium]
MRGGKFSIGNKPAFMQTLHMCGEMKRCRRQPQAQGFAAQNAMASKKILSLRNCQKESVPRSPNPPRTKKTRRIPRITLPGKTGFFFSPRAALQFQIRTQ